MTFRRRRRPKLRNRVARMTGELLFYRGDRAVVRLDGGALSMPAAPFRTLDVQPFDRFVLVTTRAPGGDLLDARVEHVAPPARPPRRMTTPPVYLKDGKAITTRKRHTGISRKA